MWSDIHFVKEGLIIYWNLSGKVDSIYKTPESKGISFLYDATGNRIGKRVHTATDVTATWYVRDAQGGLT